MDELCFILAAPSSIETTEVQVAKTGRFSDRRYGEFTITETDFDSWIRNLDRLPTADMGLPIDVDHSPEKRGTTEAAGWIKKLVKRGSKLFAEVEWNELGKQLIGENRYRFLSPTYGPAKVEGKAIGNALIGAALTNRPYLAMPAVTLDDAVGLAAEVAESATARATADSPRQMTIPATILTALGLDESADEATVLAAIESQKGESKTLDQLAKDEGKIVLDAATHKTLTDGAAAGVKALAELTTMRFETAWTGAVDAGKITPGQKDTVRALYDADPDAALKLLDELPVSVNVTAAGASGNGSADTTALNAAEFTGAVEDQPFQLDADELATFRKAEALAAKESIDLVTAMERIERGEGVAA